MKNKIFKEIFEKSPIGILFYDLDGKLADANASALKIIGKSNLDDILGTNIFHNINLDKNRNKLIEEGSLKFQSKPHQIVNEKSLFNLNESSKFIDWNISVSDSGYLVQIQDITKYKKEEEILRANEKKYQSFFEDDLTGDFIATPDGRILECNPSFVEIYNLETHEKALTKKISQFNQSDWNKITDMLKINCKIKGHQSIHTRPDGTEIHVVANIVGIFNDSNELTQIKGYVFDDTERKKAEKFLQESNEKYHKLFDEDLTGDFIATLDGEILECNPAFADIYGFYDREKASQSNISKFNSFDWPYMVTRLKREHKLQGFQSWQRRSDGMRIHVVANLVGIFNDSNELIQVKGYVFDDTERKKAEEELASSKRQMTEVLDSIQDGFIALSHYWHFIYVNHCAAEFFKVEYDDIIGQNIWEMFPNLLDTTIESKFRQAMDTREIQHFEAQGINNTKWFDFSVYPSSEGISAYWKELKTEK
jgi:PAS domain S-box-containing protein